MYLNIPLLFLPAVTIATAAVVKIAPRIAIIGGGIGGTSAAYFIRQLYEDENITLHLYEPGQIGGRMATTHIAGREYESGASILHPTNRYMSDFVKYFGLKRRDPGSGTLGLYNGQEYLFKESGYSFVTFFRLIWRYGSNILKLNSYVNSMLEKFSRIYQLQGNGYAFSTVEQLLASMSPEFPNMTKVSIADFFKQQKFSEHFLSELVEAVMNVNYGQTSDINAFVGSVSMAGAQPALWSVRNGNRVVASALLSRSMADLIPKSVVAVGLTSNGQFNVVSKYSDVEETQNTTYDQVIIATPLDLAIAPITFWGFPMDFMQEENVQNKSYHRTVATFVEGDLNHEAVGLAQHDMIDEILTNNHDLLYNSIGRLYPVDYEKGEKVPDVWKIFSQVPLTQDHLNTLFSHIGESTVVDWLAYPQYVTPETLPPFVLYPGLFYTSAIERAASAMEMSAISGRNAALLSYYHWKNSTKKVDTMWDPPREEL